jgi:hypothetical protein
LIFVPSNATWPSLTSPAVSHNFSTCRNNSPSAFKWRLRKSLIVREVRRIERDNPQEAGQTGGTIIFLAIFLAFCKR